MRIWIAALALSVAAPAFAQVPPAEPTAPPPVTAPPPTAATPTPPSPPAYAVVHVRLTTSEGPITLAIEKQRAPISAGYFLKYVDQKRLDGTVFYRAVKVAPGYGLIQGGPRNDPKRVLPAIPHEPTSKTGLSHTDGTISFARGAPGTATGDFFIVIGDLSTMDADPKQPGDNQGFAAFGHVIEGMDIVKRILDEPTSATAGPATMKGQMLVQPIKILTARRTD
ncbi:peptidyl-prolyl cis-trans isomerase A (cyclophilin A) [Sphingomonas vulcanisoli]|uniref:peptidylprolyl isomerase n=1 Tax=Sphingomonas vulcanisoli TaxID=1658060 RepID=A0ABX0TTW2_9SPHN|nr:peptidylprolyl isomerase [Sphingomonas vulcanisoli]NIJ08963.1 peptidyl-prolyl cis-trans isomerase A (cyclophilin A) [Sphingomonas vulcanisoli]